MIILSNGLKMIKTLNVNLTEEVHTKLKGKAKFNGLSMQSIAASILTLIATSSDLDDLLELNNDKEINHED